MAVFRRGPRTSPKIILFSALVLLAGGRSPAELPAADIEPVGPSARQPAELSADDAAATPISGPRDLLGRHGVGDSQLARLSDGHPVNDDEHKTLLKIIYWVGRFPLADIERWAHQELDIAQLVKSPQPSRAQLFSLAGRVTLIEPRRPPTEMVRRLQFDEYYRCRLMLDEQQPAVIFTRNVPRPWRQGGQIDQRAGAFGLFLKFASKDPARPVPVFVAPRIAWHPETPLGKLGMDVGLLDDVEDGRRLTAGERECFYQMLSAVGRAKPGQLLRGADRELKHAHKRRKRIDEEGHEHFSVAPLFNKPQQQHGRLVALSGTARRVVRIRVQDPDIVARFGIKYYYNLYVFTDDSQGNPVVFCVRELPEGMPVGDGPQYGEQVRVAGFYFKRWAYRVARPAGDLKPRPDRGIPRQLAPLLVGREPLWHPQPQPAANTLAGAIAGGLFVLALLGIWLALWRYGRGDTRFRRRTIAKARAMDSGISLSKIGLDADGAADFSRLEDLEEMDRSDKE